MNSIIPVLLAGGSGTRLWPLSRKTYPKQFSSIIGEKTLFQETALRLTSSKKITFADHITVTNSDFRFIVTEQLFSTGLKTGPILIEPEAKNTAPAILSASLYAYNIDEEAILISAPTDHLIPEKNKFHDAIKLGLEAVKKGKIIAFGIEPKKPETGYGYLKLDSINPNTISKVTNFIEKPNKKKALEITNIANYTWNSGIFLFRAKDMISAFKKHKPDLLDFTKLALKDSKLDLGFIRLDPKPWSSCENISIDYAIMEKIQNLYGIRLSINWSDLGDWNAVWEEMGPDINGVSLSKNAFAIRCNNSLLRSENEQQIIIGLGLKDIVAVSMADAVLITKKKFTQNINEVVNTIKSKKISQSEIFPKTHRPWGWYEILSKSDLFQVKKIYVNPKSALSLQSHKHRSEHWVIVEGTAKVQIDDKKELIKEGQSVYIPAGKIHRLENSTQFPIILIEVQMGHYLGEDDIIRYDDVYQRR